MRRRLAALCLLTCALPACNMDAGVDNLGSYTFLPGAPVPDTAALPLRHLLLLERDSASASTLVYYFEGDLGAAGLGLEDLRRQALRHGGFQLRFAHAPEHYASALPRAAEGALTADLDGRELVLAKLDAQGLYAVGASRWLRTLDEAEFPVRAYFGVVERAELGQLRLNAEDGVLAYDFSLGPGTPSPRVTEASVVVERAATPRAGELELELSQDVTRISDEAPLETSIVSRLAAGDAYEASAAVVLAAFAGNCWSLERPLLARVSQIRQSYEARASGDMAVIERRRDSAALDEEAFAGFVSAHGGEPALAPHCQDIR